MEDAWQELMHMMQIASRESAWDTAKIVLQLLIIGYAIVWMWRRIRATQAERLVKGIMLFVMFWAACHFMGLSIITAILREMIPVLLIAVVIVFQPELRRGLGYLGRTRFRVDFSLSDTHNEKAKEVIEQIIQAVRELSRTKTGALIVVEPPEGERDYVSPGTTLNSEVSASLLLTIFNNTSPLHDGAVVIRQNKIIAAGVILPMTDNIKLSYKYGTRHRAALGLSEKYDGLCIVASEETGAISAANRGMLVRYNSADELADALNYMYHQAPEQKLESQTPLHSFLQLFNRGRSHRVSAPGAEPGAADHPRRRSSDFPKDEKLDRAAAEAKAKVDELRTEGSAEAAG
ncbi:MAG: diadenylate cyclase CdaA [Candidatus Obscuribacterales bacterium]|nr:diadenylate cyclase CdaA [Candidatus Obscuribacterales bacterium]